MFRNCLMDSARNPAFLQSSSGHLDGAREDAAGRDLSACWRMAARAGAARVGSGTNSRSRAAPHRLQRLNGSNSCVAGDGESRYGGINGERAKRDFDHNA